MWTYYNYISNFNIVLYYIILNDPAINSENANKPQFLGNVNPNEEIHLWTFSTHALTNFKPCIFSKSGSNSNVA